MVHPIAGRNQYPFTINGIIVDGAKIDGNTYVKDLFIHKQRSYNMYDLIDASGEVYEFIEITWTSTEGVDLNYFDNSSFIVEQIRNNTFFIKIQDIPRNIYGFITLMQLNKIKVHTGDYIYYNQNDDYSLLSVRCIPATIQARKSDVVTIGVQFLPVDYKNQSGAWTAENAVISEMGRSLSAEASFHCLQVGHGVVTFTPDAHKSLSATAQIYVTDDAPEYSTFNVYQNDPSGKSLSGDNTYFPGDYITYTAVFEPFGYVPTQALELEYDENALEFLGTDDNLNYRFKVPEDTTFSGVRTQIFFKDGQIQAIGQPVIRLLTSSVNMGIEPASAYGRPGNSYQYALAYYNKPVNPNYSWSVQTSSLGNITSSGLLNVTGTGEQRIYANVNGGYQNSYAYMYSSPYIPDIYKYFPNDRCTFYVGEQIQLTAQTVPSTVPLVGTWRSRHSGDNEYFTVSNSGLLTILKEPENPYDVFYVGFTYSGASGVGGTVYNTLQSLEKSFCIAKPGVVNDITSIRMYDFRNLMNIPLGGTTETYVSLSPREATVSKNWTYTMSNPGIVELEYDPYYDNNYYLNYVRVKGVGKGQTDVTITSVSNPEVSSTYTFTVF